MPQNPPIGFEAQRSAIANVGHGLQRPGCILAARGTVASWMASITFGGADLKTAYLGSLMGTTIPSFVSPVAGLPMVHWHETH